METKKKQFKMPHTFVIIGIIILLAVLLTWIIPAGSYTRFENEAGIKVIDPNDFNYIDKTPVNPLEIPLYIVKAFIKRIDLMLVIMFAGGAFHILTKTGALHAVVAKMAKVFSTRVYLFLPILTLVFGLICTTQGVNLFIAFAPIMVMMAFAMGLDSITGASIILLGGAQWNGNFRPFTDFTFDDKIMYTCHRYGGDASKAAIQEIIDFRDRVNLPMYMGEIGHNTEAWQNAFCHVMEENNIGWTFWPYKKIDKSSFAGIKAPAGWDAVVAFSEAPRGTYQEIRDARPDQETAKAALTEFIENSRIQQCVIQNEYIRSLGLKTQ